jgi:hypothetical protein
VALRVLKSRIVAIDGETDAGRSSGSRCGRSVDAAAGLKAFVEPLDVVVAIAGAWRDQIRLSCEVAETSAGFTSPLGEVGA